MLLRFMVRREPRTPARNALELYDHETAIEHRDGGPNGCFRTALKWLPLLHELRNWMASEECRELAAAV